MDPEETHPGSEETRPDRLNLVGFNDRLNLVGFNEGELQRALSGPN